MKRNLFLSAVQILLCSCFFAGSLHAQAKKQPKTPTVSPRTLTAREIAKKAFASVVEIVTANDKGEPYALGSGFFVRGNLIVTNHHVIKEATKIYARKVGQKQFIKILSIQYVDDLNDLVLLKVETDSAIPLPLGDSKQVRVGDEIYVVGNPEGFTGTFSQGIISGLRKNDLVQITAPISHGSSGGPVLNNRGEVIAIVSSFFQEGQNLNFAVSVSCLVDPLDLVIAFDTGNFKIYPPPDPTRALKNLPAKALYAEGKKLLYGTAGEYPKYEEAKPYFEEAVRKDNNFAAAWIELGNCYTFKNNLEAADKFIQAIRSNPNLPAGHIRLGDAYSYHASSIESKNRPESIAYYRKSADSYKRATLLTPDNAETYVFLGYSLGKSSQNEKANEAFSKALKLAPNDPLILTLLSTVHLGLGRHQDALSILQKELRLAPEDYSVYLRIGDIYFHMGQDNRSHNYFQKAIEYYQTALRMSSESSAQLHLALGLTYLAMGNKESALNEYNVLISLGKKAEYQAKELLEKISP